MKTRRTAHEIVRAADVAHARSLAEQGFVEMAREILRRYRSEELPQCVVEVPVATPRRSGAAASRAPAQRRH